MKTRNNIFLAIGSVAIIAASGVGVYAMYSSSQINNTTTTPNASTTQTTNSGASSSASTDATSSTGSSAASGTSTSTTTSSYKDGTYTASANYSVPHGYQNSINVSVTIKDGVISAASATHSSSDRESAEFIDSFNSSLSSKVVGQSLSGASFSRIGGASLTTDGFQTAIETVKNEAAA